MSSLFMVFTDTALFLAERLALIRQWRAEGARKREEDKAGNVLFACPLFASLHHIFIKVFMESKLEA
jgi:hypothetical protein